MKKNRNRIIEAAALADYGHKGQFRKWSNSDVPYIIHPTRVAGRVCVKGGTEDMVVAAWLHDVLEDTSITVEDLVVRFGEKVAEIVLALTNPSKGMDVPRAERSAIDRTHLAKQSKEVKLIKLCDRIDNLGDMEKANAPQSFVKRYRAESILLLEEALTGVNEELEVELRSLAE